MRKIQIWFIQNIFSNKITHAEIDDTGFTEKKIKLLVNKTFELKKNYSRTFIKSNINLFSNSGSTIFSLSFCLLPVFETGCYGAI
jgi:hypothetical protein